MARILLGWEFGANRGHAVRLAAVAEALRAQGHEIALAATRLDVVRAQKMAGVPIWQAPLSPRLLAGRARIGGAAVGMADIIARLGMDDPLIVAAVVDGWGRLFGAIEPDLVAADFAPFLLLAARGRIPSISVGTGFSMPPPDMAMLPTLIEGAQGVDQKAVLEAVNAGLADLGEAPVASLPALFAADREIAATFAELDPYAQARHAPLAFPEVDALDVPGREGDEVFGYFPDMVPADSPLWKGLAMSGLKIRVHVGLASPAHQAAVAAHGVIVEPEPLPFAAIAERSRLLISHGGHGFICAGLLAGLPHVVCHFDLEKLCHGLALARAGLGGHVSLRTLQPRQFADSLVRVHRDDALSGRARAAAADFGGRDQIRFAAAIAAAAAELTSAD